MLVSTPSALAVPYNLVRAVPVSGPAGGVFDSTNVVGQYKLVNSAVSSPSTVGFPTIGYYTDAGYFHRFRIYLDFDLAAIPANWLTHLVFISEGYSAAYYDLSQHTVTDYADSAKRSWEIDSFGFSGLPYIPMGVGPAITTLYLNSYPVLEPTNDIAEFSFTAVDLDSTIGLNAVGVGSYFDVDGEFAGEWEVEAFYTYNLNGTNFVKMVVEGDHNTTTMKLEDLYAAGTDRFFYTATVYVNGTEVYRWLPAKYPTSYTSSNPTTFINEDMPLLSVGDEVTVKVNSFP